MMPVIITAVLLLTLSIPVGAEGGRTTGETAEDPHIIPGVPFVVTDNTCVYRNDYNEELLFADSRHDAPDIVFALTPMFNQVVTIDLRDAGFTTRLFLYENEVVPGGCTRGSDDCSSSDRAGFSSMIDDAHLLAGNTYYFVVDGRGNACGEFTLRIRKCEDRSVRGFPKIPNRDEPVCLPADPSAIRLNFPG